MNDIASKVAAVIAARRNRLPQIQAEIQQWRRADEAVVALDRALVELCGYAKTPPEIVDQLGQLRVRDVRPAITTTLEQLARVESRVGRTTLNLGVSGSARVGKSTLLQSISGLDDAQLPTGSGIPVTAVRSRIYHVPGRRRAVLELHTFDTFRNAHLQPRHAKVGLDEAPAELAEFRAWQYPKAGELADSEPLRDTFLSDLRDIHDALWSYEDLLNRNGRSLELTGDELDRLREYVAYPTVDERKTGNPARRYLAVRDARIECAFSHVDVGAVGILDLPGLGDLAIDAERHHVAGLQHDVDLVVLVKRAEEGIAFWGDADLKALKLLDEARGFVSRRRDFVFIVLNLGDAPATLVGSLRDDVLRRVNEGQDGLHYRVLEVDAKDISDVSERVLEPVLQHLVERLPVMDGEILAGTRAQANAVRDELVGLAMDVKAALRQVRGLTAGAAENLYERARELHKSLAVTLHTLLADLRDRATSHDPAYANAVEGVYHEVLGWIRNGLGVGHREWCADALRSMIRDGGVGPCATEELSRVRVEISRQYTALDLFFQERLEETWGQVAAGLAGELGGLLSDRSGREALVHLAELAGEAAEPCQVMRASLAELLALRLDYRTQVHPRVRPELDALNFQVRDPATGQEMLHIVVAPTAEGAEELYQIVSELAEQAAYRIRVELLKEAVLPGQVVFAAVEQFADALIRSGVAEREIRQLARSYRDEMWPGVFEGLDEADARVARVARAADELVNATTELGRQNT